MVTFLLKIWWTRGFILKIVSGSCQAFKFSYSLLQFHLSELSNEGFSKLLETTQLCQLQIVTFYSFQIKIIEICVKFKVSNLLFLFFFFFKNQPYTFQWNKFHSKISYGVKHMDKIYELSLISSSYSSFWPTFNNNTISINPNLKCFGAKIFQHIYQS